MTVFSGRKDGIQGISADRVSTNVGVVMSVEHASVNEDAHPYRISSISSFVVSTPEAIVSWLNSSSSVSLRAVVPSRNESTNSERESTAD